MKAVIKLALLVALAGGGYFGFKTVANAQYGIAGSTPIGSFVALDAYLIEDVGLIKSQKSMLPVRDIATTAQMYRYTNPENQYESVTLLLDGASELWGIVGVYWLGDYGSRSPVMLFSQSHWRRLGGARNPDFTEIREGGFTTSEARFETGRVSGTWEEYAEEGQQQVVIHLRPR